MDTDYDNQPDPEKAVAPAHRAYSQADTLIFRGRPLAAFSPKRFLALDAMGLSWWKLSAAEQAAAAKRSGEKDAQGNEVVTGFHYPGMFADAVKVTYLCACETSQVLRAVRKPAEVEADAMQWAEDQGIAMDDPEPMACFMVNIFGLAASAGEPAPTEEQKRASAGNG